MKLTESFEKEIEKIAQEDPKKVLKRFGIGALAVPAAAFGIAGALKSPVGGARLIQEFVRGATKPARILYHGARVAATKGRAPGVIAKALKSGTLADIPGAVVKGRRKGTIFSPAYWQKELTGQAKRRVAIAGGLTGAGGLAFAAGPKLLKKKEYPYAGYY